MKGDNNMHIKIEATFPKRDNEGNLFKQADFDVVEEYLMETAGGFSSYDSRGGWRDSSSGEDYFDSNVVYVVVVSSEAMADKVRRGLNDLIIINFRQLASWITSSSITVY